MAIYTAIVYIVAGLTATGARVGAVNRLTVGEAYGGSDRDRNGLIPGRGLNDEAEYWALLTMDTEARSLTVTALDATQGNADADQVWLLGPPSLNSGYGLKSFTAGGKIDEYIIASSFSNHADSGDATIITITDTGENLFRFRNSVKIGSISETSGELHIGFGGNAHKALRIQNAADARYVFGDDGTTRLSFAEFKAYVTANASTAAPLTVSGDVTHSDAVASKVIYYKGTGTASQRAIYDLLKETGDPETPGYDADTATGWEVFSYEVSNNQATITSTPIGDSNIDGHDTIWFLDETVSGIGLGSNGIRTSTLSAGAGVDEYIIASSFSNQVSNVPNALNGAAVIITDRGENIIRFRNGVQISSAEVNEQGALEISFRATARIGLTIWNAADAKFRIGNTSNVSLTLDEFLTLTEGATQSAPYTVAEQAAIGKMASPTPRSVVDIVEVGAAWSYDSIRFTILNDSGRQDETLSAALVHSATLADGSPLPDWLDFNADTITFSIAEDATVADNAGTYNIKFMARLGYREGEVSFALVIRDPDAPQEIFYLDNSDPTNTADPDNAFRILAGSDPTNHRVSGSGWSVVEALGDRVRALQIDDTANPIDMSGDDRVWVTATLLGETLSFSAGAGRDEYVIHVLFYNAVDQRGDTTKVTITDTGENVFRFQNNIAITTQSGLTAVNSDGALEVYFLSRTNLPLVIENAADAKFILGTTSTIELTLDEFLYFINSEGNVYIVEDFTPDNPPLAVIGTPPPSAVIGAEWEYTPPAFADSDTETLTYAAMLASGEALPSWLSFDAATRSFTIAAGATSALTPGSYEIRITGRDTYNVEGADFTLNLIPADGTLFVEASTSPPDKTTTLRHGSEAGKDTAASGAITITDSDGIESVTASKGRFGTFTLTAPTSGDEYTWGYTLAPDNANTAALPVGISTEFITLTATDNAGNSTTHDLEIDVRVLRSRPATFENSAQVDKNVAVEYGRSTGSDDLRADAVLYVTPPDGEMVASITHSEPQFGRLVFAWSPDPSVNHPTRVQAPWNYTLDLNNPNTARLATGENHTETITVTVTDDNGFETDHELNITIALSGTRAAADTAFAEADPFDKSAGLNHADASASDLTAGGTLNISDPQGLFSLSHNGADARYGTFTFDEETRVAGYTLNPGDLDLAGIRAGRTVHETITFTALDATGAITAYDLEIDVTVADRPQIVIGDLHGRAGNVIHGVHFEVDDNVAQGNELSIDIVTVADANALADVMVSQDGSTNLASAPMPYKGGVISRFNNSATDRGYKIYFAEDTLVDSALLHDLWQNYNRAAEDEASGIDRWDRITSTIVEEMPKVSAKTLAADDGESRYHLTGGRAGSQEEVRADDKLVVQDFGTGGDTTASGRLFLTSPHHIRSVEHTAPKYGTFTFDEGGGWWQYELNRENPDALAFRHGQTEHEVITFTITDGEGYVREHDLVIDIQVAFPANTPTLTLASGTPATKTLSGIDAPRFGFQYANSNWKTSDITVTVGQGAVGADVEYSIDAASAALGFRHVSTGNLTLTSAESRVIFTGILDPETSEDSHTIIAYASIDGRFVSQEITITPRDAIPETVRIIGGDQSNSSSEGRLKALSSGVEIQADQLIDIATFYESSSDVVTGITLGSGFGSNRFRLGDVSSAVVAGRKVHSVAIYASETFTPLINEQALYEVYLAIAFNRGGTPSDIAANFILNIPVEEASDAGAAPPEPRNEVADVQTAFIGQAWGYELPPLFAATDTPIIRYEAKQSDGMALPAWLTFDAATRTFSIAEGATDASSAGTSIEISVRALYRDAEDAEQASAPVIFTLNVDDVFTETGSPTPTHMVKLDYNETDNNNVMANGELTFGTSTRTTHNGDAARYGTFTLDQGTGMWTYTLNETDPDTIVLVDEMATETITFTATNSGGATATKDLVITINVVGTFAEDDETIFLENGSVPVGNTAYSTLLDHTTPDNNIVETGGVLSVVDTDGVKSVTHTGEGMYGVATLTEDNDAGIVWTGVWGYVLDIYNPATRALDEGVDTATETITITVTDDNGKTATHELMVNISVTGEVMIPDETGFIEVGAAPSESTDDKSVTLNLESIEAIKRHNFPTNAEGAIITPAMLEEGAGNDPNAMGRLIIEDDDGIKSVAHDGADVRYGVFTYDEATYQWTYTIDPHDADVLALTDVGELAKLSGGNRAIPETITFTVTDDNDEEQEHALEITITAMESGAPIAPYNFDRRIEVSTEEDTDFDYIIPDFIDFDDEADDLTYTLTAADEPWLELDNTEKSLSFDVSRLNSRDVGDWMVMLAVTDSDNNTTTETLTIAVIDTPLTRITIDSGVYLILNRRYIKHDDADSNPPSQLTITLTEIDDGFLQVYNTTTKTWGDLAVNATLTQQQIDAGHVRLFAYDNGHFKMSFAGSTNPQTIYFTIREQAPLTATELGKAMNNGTDGGVIDLSTNTENKTIATGIGKTMITPGEGDDSIYTGLNDDTVNLNEGGDDVVIYRYKTVRDNNDAITGIIAWDGGDTITGFAPGEDQLHLNDVDGNVGGMFLDGLGGGFIATLRTSFSGGNNASRDELTNYEITGIEFHFSQALLLPGGVLSGSILTILFNTPIDWNDFNTTWLTNAAITALGTPFTTNSLTFNDNDAGRAALRGLLGLDEVVAATGGTDPPHLLQNRSVVVGDDGDNTLSTAEPLATNEAAAWVIYGGKGNDTITLGPGADEVALALTYDGADVTNTDGSDTISGFTLGADRLTFTDTDGTPPTATGTASAVDALLAGFAGVSLIYGTGYDGIVFEIVADNSATAEDDPITLVVNFTQTLNAAGLAERLGLADAGAALDALFEGGSAPTGQTAPTTPEMAALADDGIALIDALFGVHTLQVSPTLPVELI